MKEINLVLIIAISFFFNMILLTLWLNKRDEIKALEISNQYWRFRVKQLMEFQRNSPKIDDI